MTILIYLIKTVLVSGLMFGYYYLFLRNRRFHDYNRFFILSIPLFSFLIPALHFNVPVLWTLSEPGSPVHLLGVGQGRMEDAFTLYAKQQTSFFLSWELILLSFYTLIGIMLSIRFYKSIRLLLLLRKNKPSLRLPGATLYFVSEEGTPFSFFRMIFWGEDISLDTEGGQQILQHELFHVKQKHSADMLFMECCTILAWFNPFLYYMRRELKAIHEYGADAYASGKTNSYAYARLLINNISGSSFRLTNPFFKNQIKRRITMITQSSKNKTGIGRIMIFPLLAILICLFSFRFPNHFFHKPAKTIRVLIDAGHGGNFPGAFSNGVYEKDYDLVISKKILSLAKEYNVDVILSRDKDESMGDGTLSSSLNTRIELVAKVHADLFISIHANMVSPEYGQREGTGFEIYIPHNENKFYPECVKLGSSISSFIKPDYIMASELKQRDTRIRVIDNATVPAIIIECGYLDNKTDMTYMMSEKNQEKIARDILEGIRNYSLQSPAYSISDRHSADSVPVADNFPGKALIKLDPDKIQSMNVDKKNNLITTDMKDGKTYTTVITPELLHSLDSIHALEQTAGSDIISSPVFTKTEVPASFPGGQDAWYDYLSKNMKYPDSAISKEIQGQVIVQFIVRKDGNITDIKVLSGPQILREAAVNAVEQSGKWNPAKQNGYLVDSYHQQPFNFRLEKSYEIHKTKNTGKS